MRCAVPARMPGLRVGLHLVVIEGAAVLPAEQIPDLVGRDGQFPSDQLRLGINYFFHPGVRTQLAAEICAQFAAFAATGLTLAHADVHKHMQLHPTVGRLLIDIGRQHGVKRVRAPVEPPGVLAACGHHPTLGARALHAWARRFQRQAWRAGLSVPDYCFGIAWSGHMTAEKVLRLAAHLPDGASEIYFHPATHQDPILRALMPEYDHAGELAALLDPALRRGLGPAIEAIAAA